MRTTLVLNDDLFRRAKIRAAERNVTLSELVNEALREVLVPPHLTAPPFTLITYGRGQPQTRHEPSDFSNVLDTEDQDRLR